MLIESPVRCRNTNITEAGKGGSSCNQHCNERVHKQNREEKEKEERTPPSSLFFFLCLKSLSKEMELGILPTRPGSLATTTNNVLTDASEVQQQQQPVVETTLHKVSSHYLVFVFCY